MDSCQQDQQNMYTITFSTFPLKMILSGELTLLTLFIPFWKGVYSERKEFAPLWTSFRKGNGPQNNQTGSHKKCLPCE